MLYAKTSVPSRYPDERGYERPVSDWTYFWFFVLIGVCIWFGAACAKAGPAQDTDQDTDT